MNSKTLRGAAIPILIVALIAYLLVGRSDPKPSPKNASFSALTRQVKANDVKEILVDPAKLKITVTPKNANDFKLYSIGYATEKQVNDLQAELKDADAANLLTVKPNEGPGAVWSILQILLPIALLIGFWIFIMNQMQGGGSKVMQFGKSRAKKMAVDAPKVNFRDVAGADEAVEELHEIKEFLENPKKFQALGARIPKGVLLFGPPGTGKTLLARAVAGGAGVPFFSISGSDFVEMFVGVGASRVRDLFEQAKLHSPCIIFVDEIDAVGRHRGAGMGGGNDEREQTLNQLLVEMDGFEGKDNIIVIAATNRPDILDPALLRPGRFDRQIRVDAPDRAGRLEVLKVHSKGKPLAKTVDLEKIAAQTSGFTGADLANLINESALLSARRGLKRVGMPELEEAIMRVIVGPEKKGRKMSEREKKVTAVHEMGHALLAHYQEHADPPHKISIIGRGMALGYVVSLPTEDRYTRRKVELMASITQALGGRVAEEVVFGEFTTGAENDLQKVTQMAKRMVMKWGMSDSLGARSFGSDQENPFLGRDFHAEPDYSDGVAREIDREIQRIIDEAHDTARTILTEHREELERLGDVLVDYETIDSEEFERLVAGDSPIDVFGVGRLAEKGVVRGGTHRADEPIVTVADGDADANDDAAEASDEPSGDEPDANSEAVRPGAAAE
ncbi:MAG: ATP-dependent metallopeptidase FtsH/Yme1/Tma family protein [Thermoleophilia bacterium]|nr:ATP-dependent metallopeptidase FtsH/Yme1/Tma family protein [Thermoleophilia bacterium]